MFASLSRLLPRGLSVAVLLAAPAMLSAPAAIAQAGPEFRGGGYIASLNNCEGIDPIGGVMPVTARYEPGELEGNAESSLTVSNAFAPYTFNLSRNNNVFEENWTRVRGIHLVPSRENWDALPRLRILQQVPQELSESTERMRLRVRVRHMFNIQGCRAEIDLEMVRH